MTTFKDNFSKQSDLYAKYRPHYPSALFAFLASLTPKHQLAWDCGTGNGQAALGLTEFYDQIIATDPSKQQIKNSLTNHKIEYRIENTENSSLAHQSADLISIANALHWFQFDSFYKEARRVLKPEGILAAWCYRIPSISEDIDKVVQQFNDEVMDEYWLPENRLVDKDYSTLPFPFKEIICPHFYSRKNFTLHEFIKYLTTWSAIPRFIEKNKFNPLGDFEKKLKQVWLNAEEEKTCTWKITLKAGRL